MLLEEFIIWVYCWVDENYVGILGETNIRKRGHSGPISSFIYLNINYSLITVLKNTLVINEVFRSVLAVYLTLMNKLRHW